MVAKSPKEHWQKDTLLQWIIKECEREGRIEKVLLFGSRARGDAKERSDYDLAFYAPKMTYAEWAEFALHLEENAPTLKSLDLIHMQNEMRKPLKDHIENEGIQIYEHPSF
jgi:uncharacterized protein